MIWIATTPASAIFLQRDTANQDYVALAWVRGCWEFFTEKMLAVYFLAPLFRLFGPSPRWEQVWLAVLAAVSAALVYLLTKLVSRSRFAGVLAVGLLLSLPAFQFFNRTYFGYLFPFLLLGWLAAYYQRWLWTGLFFGLAILGHFNSLVPVGLSTILLFVYFLRHVPVRQWFFYAAGGLAPLIITEGLFFFYMGHVHAFVWLRGTIDVIRSPLVESLLQPGWLWVAAAIAMMNGWILAGTLLFGALAAPLVLRRDRYGLALGLSFAGVVLFYTLQAGLSSLVVVPRLLMSALPFWCIAAGILIAKAVASLPAQGLRTIASVSAVGLVVIGAASTGAFIRQFTQTLIPKIDQAFQQAAAEARPVRMVGHPQVALFYSQLYGVELLVNDTLWIESWMPDQAVLIFEGEGPTNLTSNNYDVRRFSLRAEQDRQYPALTEEAGLGRAMEVWWPINESKSVNPGRPTDIAKASYYYAGAGCFTPPVYSDGDRPRSLHYYQLAWKKVLAVFGQA